MCVITNQPDTKSKPNPNANPNPATKGSVTMTTEVGTDGATTMSRMNLSGYVGHATIFNSAFTIACCLVVGLELGLGLGLDVSGW